MGIEGRYNCKAGRVTLRINEGDFDDVDHALQWLEKIKVDMRRRRIEAAGGSRWLFEKGDDPQPQACRKVGDTRYGAFALAPVLPRKATKCDSCREEIGARGQAWKQAPGVSAGYSKYRFCDACVTRGGRHPPPNLVLLEGGKGNHG